MRYVNHKGMTLVEIMISLVIFGLIMSAMYSVYISMNNRSVEEQGVVDIQQDLRLALELIGQDIKMAGAVIPTTENPISTATSNSITVQTASSLYLFAALGSDLEVASGTAASDEITFSLSMPTMVDYFSDGDTVRIIRPQSGEQPLNLDFTVSTTDRTDPSITLTGLNTPNAIQYKQGDLMVPIPSGAPDPSNVVWDRDSSNLRRNRDNSGTEIVSGNITNLAFFYILDDDSETTSPASSDLDNIKAVRVVLTGEAADQLDGATRQRSLESTFYLRNKLL